MTTRILLLNRDRWLRKKIRLSLSNQSDMCLLLETSDESQAVTYSCLEELIDVIIIDHSLSDVNINRFTIARKILTGAPSVKIVIRLTYSDGQFMAFVHSAITSDYQLINCTLEDLPELIRNAVENGRTEIPRESACVSAGGSMTSNSLGVGGPL